MSEHSNLDYEPSFPRHLFNSGIIATVYSGLAYADQKLWETLEHSEALLTAQKQFPISYGAAMVNAYTYNKIRQPLLKKYDNLYLAMGPASLVVSAVVGTSTWVLQEKTGTDGAALLGFKTFCANIPFACAYDFVFLQHQGNFKSAALAVLEKAKSL